MESPEGFKRGVLFSALSARQPIVQVPGMLRDALQLGVASKALALPNKRNCFLFMEEHGRAIHRAVQTLPTEGALEYLARNVPGLGIVKGAFALQLAGRDIGCFDSHNLQKIGLPLTTFTGRSRKTFQRYLDLACGQSQVMWDTWCTDRAVAYHRTPDDISALHLAVAESS